MHVKSACSLDRDSSASINGTVATRVQMHPTDNSDPDFNTHMQVQMYPQAAHCYEELLMHMPHSIPLYVQYADIMYTMGGSNFRTARPALKYSLTASENIKSKLQQHPCLWNATTDWNYKPIKTPCYTASKMHPKEICSNRSKVNSTQVLLCGCNKAQ